ncbi:MAG: HD domain-containing protein, partial [Clostridia bacterium]|nr:HD domain-containing protein [Clostridia bacterium]
NYEIKEIILKCKKEKEGLLSPIAAKDKDCIRRQEYEYNFFRRGYVRDCETIINLAQYNRYGGKTQVFSMHSNNDISTRALHVGLVSRIARTIGEALNLNTALIEAIASAHDLGHAPFGHKGEKWLDKASKTRGYRFAHHVQGARYLDTIVRANISLPVIDGVLSHNGEQLLQEYKPNEFATKSFEQLDEKLEAAYAGKLPQSHYMPATLEGCLVRLCDVVAYIGKDRQDAHRLGLVDEYDYTDSGIGVLNHDIIGKVAEDIIYNSYGKDCIAMSDSVYRALLAAMQENYKKIYLADGTGISEKESKDTELAFVQAYEFILHDALGAGKLLDEKYYPYIYANKNCVAMYKENNLKYPERIAADFIASMCDRYFISFYNKYIGKLQLPMHDYFD